MTNTLFDTTDTTKIKYENKLIYDFQGCTINLNEITKDADNKITSFTFLNQTPEPNIIYTQSESSTASLYHKKAYIYNSIFKKGDDNSIKGELIIEHTPLSDSSDKHYVCFLLKYEDTDNINEMDKLIEFLYQSSDVFSTEIIELNKCIESNICVVAPVVSSNNAELQLPVYVFTTPITINSSSVAKIADILNNGIFDTNQEFTAYSVIPSTNITLRGGDDIYIDCSPTGESQETINTYSIPINSDMETSLDARDTMKTATNFALFTMFAFAILTVSPHLYQMSVIRYVLNNTNDDKSGKLKKSDDVFSGVGLRTIDMFISIISVIIIIITLIVGFNKDYFPLILGGLIFSTAVLLSGIAIFNSKNNPDFLSLNSKKIIYGNDANEIANASYFDWKAFKHLILDVAWFIPFLLGIITIVTTMIVQLYIAKTDATGGLVTMGAFFIIAIIMYIYSQSNKLATNTATTDTATTNTA